HSITNADPDAERRSWRAELLGSRERRVKGIPRTTKVVGAKDAEVLIGLAEEIVDPREHLPIAIDLPAAIECDNGISGHLPIHVAGVLVAARILRAHREQRESDCERIARPVAAHAQRVARQ